MNTEATYSSIESMLDDITTESATRRPPLPVGDYPASIKDITLRTNIQGKKDPSKSYNFMDIQLTISVPLNLVSEGFPPEVTLTHGILFDMNSTGKGLDWSKGKNGNLRRYRESLDMNTPGQPYNPRMMIGRMLTARIKHDLYEGELIERIDTVSKA